MPKGMPKQEAISTLKLNWDILHPKVRKELITALMGHRVKFLDIAHQTGRSLTEIKNAWNGVVEEQPVAVAIPTAAPAPEVISYTPDPEEEVGIAISPKVADVAPMKALYAYSFDEILAKYRDYIGWTNPSVNKPVPPVMDKSEWLDGIIISDIHAPFHDEEKFAKVIADTKGKVDVCVVAGDASDFHNYSKYMKYGQHFTSRDEHKAVMLILAKLSEAYPEVVVMPGNHDERTRKKYAQSLDPALYQALLDFHGPNCFDFTELMTRQFENIVLPEAPKNGWAEYRFLYQINDIVIGHPELFSKIANRPVGNFIDWLKKKAEPMGLVKPFSAVVMGHTHQAGKTFNDFGIVGIENGCLCMTPDYDGQAKCGGALRPAIHGYTRFRTNKVTGKTDPNDINFVRV